MTMKKFMKALLVSSLVVLLLPTQTFARDFVERLTRPETVNAPNGDVYSEVKITCVGMEQARYITRKAGQFKWCVTPNGSECTKNKLPAAKKACALSADVAVTQSISQGTAVASKRPVKQIETAQKPAPVPVTAAVTEQGLEREKRMIEIAQEKIKLRRQELEFRKQQLELESGE